MNKYILFIFVFLNIGAIALAETLNQQHVIDNYWRLCKDVTQEYIDSDVFATVGQAALMYRYGGGSGDHDPLDLLLKFVVDPYWNRLVVGRENGNEDAWVKAYGEYGDQDGQFYTPSAIDVSPEGLIFIADENNYRVSIYYYDGDESRPQHINETIVPVTHLYFTHRPIDICWDDGGSADYIQGSTAYDDYLWVLTDDGSIYFYRYGFSHSPVPSIIYTPVLEQFNIIDNPRSIARGRTIDNGCANCDEMGNDKWIYLSEGNDQIRCFEYVTDLGLDDPPYDEIVEVFTKNLPTGTLISSVNVSPLGCIWITDASNHRILKYYNPEDNERLIYMDSWGSWGTGNQPGKLSWPKSTHFALKVVEDPQNGGWKYDTIAGMTVAERWSNTTGGVNAAQGIKIKDFDVNFAPGSGDLFDITFFTTAFATDWLEGNNDSHVEITRGSTPIATLNFDSYYPFTHLIQWDSSDPNEPEGFYTFTVYASSFDETGDDEVSKTICTNDSPHAIIVWFPYGRELPNGQGIRAQIYADIIGDRDSRGYRLRFECPYELLSRTEMGTLARIQNYDLPSNEEHFGRSIDQLWFRVPDRWIDFDTDIMPDEPTDACTITLTVTENYSFCNQESNGAVTAIRRGFMPECPFFYSVTSEHATRHNNILTASIDTSEENLYVEDYILLNEGALPESDVYSMFIREDGKALDSLDMVQLITVDHEPETQLALTPEGDIFSIIEKIGPTKANDSLGNDITALVNTCDDTIFVSDQPGWLEVQYEGLDLRTSFAGVLSQDTRKMPTNLTTGKAHPNILTISVETDTGWIDIGRAFPRANNQITYFGLEKYIKSSMKVRYRWERAYAVDFLPFVFAENINSLKCVLNPKSARLDGITDVKDILKGLDHNFVELRANRFIDLIFPYYKLPTGKERTFIFYSAGKYLHPDSLPKGTPLADLPLPAEIAIRQNYPNPFNDRTVIHYDIPSIQDISVDIFNVLGQKVTNLVSGTVEAGYHKVTWDGNNNSGERVASGIYFYILNADNKRIVKKMVLLK